MDDKQRFNKYTSLLRKEFPTWSKIRKDPNAIGSQFLSVVGLDLEEMEWVLDYAYKQTYIGTADINQADIVYKARIPNSLRPDTNYRFSSDSHILHPSEDVNSFLAPPRKTGEYPSLQRDTDCYIDFDSKYIYVKYPFGKNEEYNDGYVTLSIVDEWNTVIHSEPMPLLLHHVWNFFDEFGLLLNTPRLHGERNASYKERILDVFRRPANSAFRGLINGISRELGLTREVQWEDAGKDLTLYHKRIDKDSIFVNNQLISSAELEEDSSGRIILKGIASEKGVKKQVRYIAGITIHELHDKEDKELQRSLYSVDGHATDLLKYYVESIRNQVPIMWGQWKWNQGFWNISDETMSGYGYIPTTYDGSIRGWKAYTPKEG
jgi:hypothetical protein